MQRPLTNTRRVLRPPWFALRHSVPAAALRCRWRSRVHRVVPGSSLALVPGGESAAPPSALSADAKEISCVGFSSRASEIAIYGPRAARDAAALLANRWKHNEGLGCLYLRALADVDSKASSNGWRAGCRAEAEGGRGAGRPGNRLAPTGREPWRPRRPRASEIDRPPRVSPRCVSRSRDAAPAAGDPKKVAVQVIVNHGDTAFSP